MMEPGTVALIGFGEAAMAFAGAWPAKTRAFDIKTGDPQTAAAKRADYARNGIDGTDTLAEALAEPARPVARHRRPGAGGSGGGGQADRAGRALLRLQQRRAADQAGGCAPDRGSGRPLCRRRHHGAGSSRRARRAAAGQRCEKVLAGELYHCADNVAEQFPLHRDDLEGLGVKSYLAIPVTSAKGQVLGHVAVMDTKRMELGLLDVSVFKIFGARAGAELERLHMETLLKENEARLRDLFDEAPIAYVHEGLDSRFIEANRAAMRVLGIKPEEIAGMFGKSLVPDTPDAQRRLREALDSIGRGTDTSGVVLELRRKDNGKPVWVQWWSRPAARGRYTRTMFVDITDRMVMEQEKARLEAANIYLQEEIKTEHNFEEIIGTSDAIKKVFGPSKKWPGRMGRCWSLEKQERGKS